MSATVPPTANGDRPSDFGEFWRHAEGLPRTESLMPEAELAAAPALSPEQHARRLRFRRGVALVIAGLTAFTALAAVVDLVKSRTAAGRIAHEATPAIAGSQGESRYSAAVPAAPPASAAAAQAGVATPPAAVEQALSLARNPVATFEDLQAWTRLVGQLSAEDRKHAEHDLSRSSVNGGRASREAARLRLALLWRVTARRAKAQKVLVSLARTATDPVVKKYALSALTDA